MQKQIQTYTEAVKTVAAAEAVGKPHSLWCAFAHFYERHGDIANARVVFDKATQVRPAACTGVTSSSEQTYNSSVGNPV